MTFKKGHKGFAKYGADNPACRFDGRVIAQIKRLAARGVSQIKTAQRLGCSASYVSMVLAGERRARK